MTVPLRQAPKPSRLNPADIGRKVLDGLAKAHAALKAARANKMHENLLLILNLAAADQQRGWPKWGRAGRISRKLGGLLCERAVNKYLDRLAAWSELEGYPGASPNLTSFGGTP